VGADDCPQPAIVTIAAASANLRIFLGSLWAAA